MQNLQTPTNLDRTAATTLHQSADVSRLNAGSDERSDVVMVQLRQLHMVLISINKTSKRHLLAHEV